jgi:hypothetical protein
MKKALLPILILTSSLLAAPASKGPSTNMPKVSTLIPQLLHVTPAINHLPLPFKNSSRPSFRAFKQAKSRSVLKLLSQVILPSPIPPPSLSLSGISARD